jgi:hypothetical protein
MYVMKTLLSLIKSEMQICDIHTLASHCFAVRKFIFPESFTTILVLLPAAVGSDSRQQTSSAFWEYQISVNKRRVIQKVVHTPRNKVRCWEYLHTAEPFSKSWQLFSLSSNFTDFLVPEGSLPCSQEPTNCPYSEPDESNPLLNITFILELF